MDRTYLITKDIIRTDLPELKPGMKVRVFEKVKEGDKERIAQFSGIVIATKHGIKTPDATFTVRAVLDGIGVERTWPFHSPNIEKIEILDTLKVRRAKIYFIRELSPKKLRRKLRSLREFLTKKKEVEKGKKENESVEGGETTQVKNEEVKAKEEKITEGEQKVENVKEPVKSEEVVDNSEEQEEKKKTENKEQGSVEEKERVEEDNQGEKAQEASKQGFSKDEGEAGGRKEA